MTLSRRGFLGLGATAAGAMLDSRPSAADPPTPDPRPAPGGPVAIASANGLRGVAKAYGLMRDGVDPLDAAIAGVNLPRFNLQLYALSKDGAWGGAAIYGAAPDDERPWSSSFAVADAAGARYAPLAALYPASERPG